MKLRPAPIPELNSSFPRRTIAASDPDAGSAAVETRAISVFTRGLPVWMSTTETSRETKFIT